MAVRQQLLSEVDAIARTHAANNSAARRFLRAYE